MLESSHKLEINSVLKENNCVARNSVQYWNIKKYLRFENRTRPKLLYINFPSKNNDTMPILCNLNSLDQCNYVHHYIRIYTLTTFYLGFESCFELSFFFLSTSAQKLRCFISHCSKNSFTQIILSMCSKFHTLEHTRPHSNLNIAYIILSKFKL